MKQFHNKTVLVTGAAGGIGRLMALGFAKRGSNIIAVDLNLDGAKKIAGEVEALGRKAWAYALDVSDVEAVHQLRKQIKAEVGPIDALVNNAGVVFGGAFEAVPLEKHLLTYHVNTTGLVAVTHAFFEDLLQSEDGHLINIASASGFIGLPYGSTYASSKWAVVGFSESIRLELQERRIDNLHVTTVCPSYIATGMFNGVKAPKLLPFLQPDEIVAKIMEGVENDDIFVKEPFMVKGVELLRGVLPRKVWDTTAKVIGISTSMTNWSGHTK